MDRRNVRRVGRRVRAVVLVVGLGLGSFMNMGTAHAQITIAKSGAHGYLVSYVQSPRVACSGADYGPNVSPRVQRSVNASAATITRSTSVAYQYADQTLWTKHTLKYWNGTSWIAHQSTGWMTQTVGPYRYFYSQGASFPISSGGWSWRVVSEYVWSAGSVRLGDATNLYSASEYGNVEDTTNLLTIRPLNVTIGTSQGSGYCKIS